MFFYRVIPNRQCQHHALSVASQIHGPSYHKRGNISNRSCLVYPVYFGPFWSIQSTSFTSVQFGPLRSISSNSIYFGLFGPFRSHLTNSVYSVHSIHFGPFCLIRSILAHFVLFGPIQCTNLRMTKDKFWLKILLIIWVISIVIIG